MRKSRFLGIAKFSSVPDGRKMLPLILRPVTILRQVLLFAVKNMTQEISEKRKFIYDTGLFVMLIGGCLFALPLVAILFVAMSDQQSERVSKVPIAFIGGFMGFILLAAGGIMRNIAADRSKEDSKDNFQKKEKSA